MGNRPPAVPSGPAPSPIGQEDFRRTKLQAFVDWAAARITGDEKGQAQIFLDRLFQAFGQPGSLDVGGEPEMRIRKAKEDGGGTSFADYVWKPVVLIEMKKRGVDLAKHYRQAFDYWTRLSGKSKIVGQTAYGPAFAIRPNAHPVGPGSNFLSWARRLRLPLRSGDYNAYSTVTLLARFRGLSTLHPRATAAWYASSCSGTTLSSGCSGSGAGGT